MGGLYSPWWVWGGQSIGGGGYLFFGGVFWERGCIDIDAS